MSRDPGRRRASHWAVAVIAGLALGSSACGGADATRAKSAGPAGAPEEFGLTLAALSNRVNDTEQVIASCMAAAGFRYVALDFPTIKKAMDSDQTAKGLSDEAYLKQYGLGITTQFDKPTVVFGAGPQNMAALNALAPSDQVAYRRALWGEAPDWTHTHALEAEDFSQAGGCTRRAAEKTYAAEELTGTYVNPNDKLVDQDPRMIAALKKWSDCVRAKGYQYDHPDQIDADLRDRLAAITLGQDPKTLTGPALATLRQLQGEELAIAAVHHRCEADFVEGVRAKVESEVSGRPPA